MGARARGAHTMHTTRTRENRAGVRAVPCDWCTRDGSQAVRLRNQGAVNTLATVRPRSWVGAVSTPDARRSRAGQTVSNGRHPKLAGAVPHRRAAALNGRTRPRAPSLPSLVRMGLTLSRSPPDCATGLRRRTYYRQSRAGYGTCVRACVSE